MHCCLWCKDYDSKTIVCELNGLQPAVDLLKSEYAVIQSLALTALQLITEDGRSACVLNLTTLLCYYPCSLLYLERLFCFTYQTTLAPQDGGVYLVTIDREFSDVCAPYLLGNNSDY